MSYDVVAALMSRVLTHCDTHGLEDFTFVLHGGEPLVAPKAFYKNFVSIAKQILGDTVKLRFAIQTNGTLIDEEWCELFVDADIRLSISLDGPGIYNDRYRVDRKGRGSFDRVMKGWNIARLKGIEPGLLVVLDLETDPEVIYNFVREIRPRVMDFLLPDATHDRLPAKLSIGNTDTPYARWLLKIFNLWQAEDGGGISIRLFTEIMRTIVGNSSQYDVFGNGHIQVLIVESDGEIQPLDGLRFCKDGIVNTPFNVLSHELDDAYKLPIIQHYYNSHHSLCDTCQGCRLRRVCGGGFLPHRYSASRGFDNPTVYCEDSKILIDGVYRWFADNVDESVRGQFVMDPPLPEPL